MMRPPDEFGSGSASPIQAPRAKTPLESAEAEYRKLGKLVVTYDDFKP